MRRLFMRSLTKRVVLIGIAAFCAVGVVLPAQNSKDRDLKNGWEVHRELEIPAEARTAVKDYFPSFLEYQDIVMFHPKVGYYASGRVSFTSDYQTFPIVLAPLFGHMVAEQIFFMWDGMRKAGTLGDKEQFTIAEFGAGDGVLAESILDYLQQKSIGDARWRQFANQVLYVCYDRSPALNDTQRKRNARFGSRFAARLADATNLTATIPPGSFKGVVLSNELPDAFSVHKIALSPSGSAEVAFVVPSLPGTNWSTVRPLFSVEIAKQIEEADLDIEKKFFSGRAAPDLYLTRASFVSLLENLLGSKEYEATANAMQFQEIYVPVSAIPEVAAHLRRYAGVYAGILAKNPHGLVTYINPGVESFIQGAAEVLKSGYVLTIDYGSTWDGILAEDSFSHFRTYGPAHKGAIQSPEVEDAAGAPSDPEIWNPYLGPTLNDMTTDVNFSLMVVEGEHVGLKPIYFGSQGALRSGTRVTFDNPPRDRHEKFDAWSYDFENPSVYKVLVQQKEGTDKAYRFPDKNPESLGLDQTRLTEAQRNRATQIEKQLIGDSAAVPVPVR
jgi:SAM-dependent MidA family methyltransferase